MRDQQFRAENRNLGTAVKQHRQSYSIGLLIYHIWFIMVEIYLDILYISFKTRLYLVIFTSLAKEVMFLVALVSLSVCLSVCLFVCGQHYSKSYERIGMKFYGRVLSSTRKNRLNFGGDLGIVR